MPHHKHQHFHNKVKRVPVPLPEVTTENGVVMSVVYVTAEPTFTGVIGGFSTITDTSASTSASQASSSAATAAAASSSSTVSHSVVNLATVPSIISEDSQSTTSAVSVAQSTAQANSVTSTAVYTPSTSVHGAASTDTSSTTSTTANGDMSTAGKAGLAIGIIGGIGLMLALILFVLAKKKKKQQLQEQHDGNDSEKYDYNNKSVVGKVASNAPDAPKLSLRPVSRLVSEFVGGAGPKNRLSQSHSNKRTSSAGPRTGSSMLPLNEKSISTENPFQDPENPFADTSRNHLAIAELAAKGPDAQSSGLAPTSAPLTMISPRPESSAAPSPIVSQGPGPEGVAQNVYRILIDFVPSMEDELELKSGQLVRLLHEYDDGWALCIRLDRSQQGVVPRTCLAAKPSKPRPGPGRESGRGSPQPFHKPTATSGRMSPAVPQPLSPAMPPVRMGTPSNEGSGAVNTGAFNQPARPLSPGPKPQQRSMSPGPYGAGGPKPMAGAKQRRRSNSASAANVRDRRNSPPGPSKLGPGPGTAL